jgi:hypothetical protein
LADSGVIDSFVVSTGWRGFPKHAIDQIKQHETQKQAAIQDA